MFITFFMNNKNNKYTDLNKNKICLFSGWLTSNYINFVLYIEDIENTEKYNNPGDIIEWELANESNPEADKRLTYSYWNWLYDITTSKIEKYLLIDGPSVISNSPIEEKNIYLYRKIISNLIKKEPNFYFINKIRGQYYQI